MNISAESRHEREFNEANPVDHDSLADDQYQEEAMAAIRSGIRPEHEYGKDWTRFNVYRETERADEVEKQADRELDRQAAAEWQVQFTRETAEREVGKTFDPTPRFGLREENGQHVALVSIPDHIQEKFSLDILERAKVKIEASERFELKVNVDGDQVSLDRQFNAASYQGRFEEAVFKHHEANLNEDAARMAADAEAARHPAIRADYHSPAHDLDEGNFEIYKVAVDHDRFDVEVRYDEDHKVVDVQLAGHQDDYDYESDGGARLAELAALVEEHRGEMTAVIQEQFDASKDAFLKQFGWDGDKSMEAGYCVISREEVDRLKQEADDAGRALIFAQGHTVDGRPVDLTFNMKGNIEAASPSGLALPLKPVIENSRDHLIEAKAELSDQGVSVNKNKVGEYKVDFYPGTKGHVPGDEGSAYYADDLSDAVNTARAKIAWRENEKLADNDEDHEREREVAR